MAKLYFFGNVNKRLTDGVWKDLKGTWLQGNYPESSGFVTEKVNESWQLILWDYVLGLLS